MMSKRFLLTIPLMMAIVIAACSGGGGGGDAPTRGDVIVYVAVPLSGFQANGGQTILGGVRLAAAEINNDGGLLGYRVVVRPLDDESDSDVALSRTDEIRQAIDAGDRVLAVIGHLNSGQTLAAMDVYQDLPLVVIAATASEQSLTERNYDNFFRVNANDSVQANVSADFLVDQLQAKSVAVLYNNTEYGRGLAASLVDDLRARGATIALQAEVEEGQSIYTDEVAQIKNAAPDAIFYAGYEIEAPYLRAALVESGVDAPMLASDGAFLAATIDESNGAAEGMYVNAFAPSPRNAADDQWIEAYQAVEYRNPDTYSVNGYVALQVLAEAVRKADSFERAAVTESLRSNSFDTLLSSLRFEPDGDLVDPQIWVYQVVDNEFQQVAN
ncbi:branched-chain amino acid ABC transporter substrate-binding protein [Caldilinea sp.]|uniref:branched-chain amino acid ABC transporter substrate-binding protein n=1 Tax=Caldilinea sp. TaxID=2293560 RepID=UPI002CEC8B9A|nr:branched-chain amino acid ABC transporter substrate-binding protein [Caldilinea sp.]HRA65677.1 branched-chain amino acid ABC transporter substrate-binding protein [Caldilinea sp.]